MVKHNIQGKVGNIYGFVNNHRRNPLWLWCGGAQVKEHSAHARLGMHMQQCLAALTTDAIIQLSSIGSLFMMGRVLSANDSWSSFHNITPLDTIRPLHRAGTQLAKPQWVTVRWLILP